jgi:hypothetical protein
MIELNLLDSVWCGDDEKEKKKKGKANKKPKKNKQSEWTEHNTSKRKEVEGPVVECFALRCHFCFFLAQRGRQYYFVNVPLNRDRLQELILKNETCNVSFHCCRSIQ